MPHQNVATPPARYGAAFPAMHHAPASRSLHRVLRRLFLPCLVLISGTVCADAQSKPFSLDQSLFLQEVTEFLVAANKKEGREFIEGTFAPAWNGNYFTRAQQEKVVEVANFMQKKRFEAFPYFRDYLDAVARFPIGGRAPAEFDAWMRSMDKVVAGGRKQAVGAYIATCVGLFQDNTIFSSASTTWRSGSSSFTFDYDSVPKIIFSKGDIICHSKGDSAVIRQTEGTYYPSQELWKGKGGRVTWERAGLKATSTYADWDHAYTIRLKSSEFTVDSVRFYDPYFEKPLLGRLSDKVLANVKETNAGYPRFESYDRRMKIRNIADEIDFEGGFTMQGARLQGYGTREEPAYMTFYREKKPFIISSGLSFSIEPERITSDDVFMRMKLDKDSIYHHNVSMRFLKDRKQLSVIKKEEGLSKAPFYNTFHQLDMYFEVMTWKQGDPVVQMGALSGSSQTKASFESFNYFRQKRYMGMLGIDNLHPLARLNDLSKKNGGKFYAQDFANHAKLQKDQVISMLIDMANKGYLVYDTEEEWVEVTPRLQQHILNNAGKKDYDALQINSTSEDGINATLNLLNNDLTMKGVARIVLSDSQDVKIFPSEKTIVMKKGRDFSFGGSVHAGKLQYFGKDYFFHYDNFLIDLLNVDSVAFHADSFEPDEQGNHSLIKVKNVLEQVTGTLEVDHPFNKSGLKEEDHPDYPKFNSTRESYVYYDRRAIQRGVYDRDRFYYKSDPFQIDSLDNFTNAGLFFNGTLVSGGIFPDIHEPLRLQADYSLGFERATGEAGLPLYGRKAQFTDNISLNGRGLQGNGELAFLSTKLSSKALIFTPDSTIGRADTLVNKAGTSPAKVPHVAGADLYVRLEPAKDMLHSEKLRKPMAMFEGQAELHGFTELTPKGMTGAGLVDFGNATLEAALYTFETMKLLSDTADFRLTEGDISSIAFSTDNVNASVDLVARRGDFVSNGTDTKVEFPANQYVCFMDRFKWYMDEGDIELESDRTAAAGSEELQLSGSNFISIRPDQDSLSFMAPRARYDLKNHLITASDVHYIQVADALISPDSAIVRIRKNAQLDPLENAKVTANFVNKFHKMYNATVNIKARRNYTATADYDYVDQEKRAFKIPLYEIRVDSTFQTVAKGRIAQDQDFQLSPAFDFHGDVFLSAGTKHLTFNGTTRIQHGCEGLARNWMGFSGPIDPMEVYIPVADTLYDDLGAPIGAGVYLSSDDPFITYGTFLSRTNDPADKPLIRARGLLYYDRERKEYMISNKDKIRKRELPGDLVSLAVENCVIMADGRIDHGVNLGRVDVDGVGSLRFETSGTKATTQEVLLTNFHFHDPAMERMATEILSYPDQKQLDISKTYYEKMLREVLGLERSDKLISELSIKGEIKKLPDEILKSIVFADVKMKWDGPEQSWLSEGDLGIATILKKPVYRYVKGKIQLERKRSGDIMTIYIQLDENAWYFFQYSRNYLYAFSSDQQFNTMISELKDDKRKLDGGRDQPAYQYIITNRRKVDDFRDRFGL
jgi:hypothetical protein